MSLLLDRTWLISSTTYGTWLPGDSRGFVGPVDNGSSYVIHNLPQTPCDGENERLAKWCSQQMIGPPIYLSQSQAEQVIAQFLETCSYRKWKLLCTSAMANHFHAILTVPGDPPPEKLLNDLKSYASRALNRSWGRPPNDTWWTQSGSKRKKATQREVINAVRYVWNQKGRLARYIDPEVPTEWLTPESGARQGRGRKRV